MRNGQKVIGDFILTTKETIFILQQWLVLLERQQTWGQGEADEFEAIYQRLYEVGLGNWLEQASGYDLVTLSQAIKAQVQTAHDGFVVED